MSLWIFDTDHVSFLLRGHPQVIAHLKKVTTQTKTTIITVQKIFNGWMGELNQPQTKREAILNQYRQLFIAMELLKSLPILEFDAAAYDRYEALLGQNPNLRKQRLQKDLRIAAIALSHNATIVSRNRRDFEQVPGLKIEDWTI